METRPEERKNLATSRDGRFNVTRNGASSTQKFGFGSSLVKFLKNQQIEIAFVILLNFNEKNIYFTTGLSETY